MSKLPRFSFRAALASAVALINATHARANERRLERHRADFECGQGHLRIGHPSARARYR